ncbi:Retrovirus-related Pol polyprotein from transposon 17.6 [Labeo rohita]|uniref:ribonuclease H n=1 Tax=Labeo rohita TaxID=84645 RepID=A0ABQ8LY51_LABRO|nr:Retrovirus-related Pol polyprotein from transposon 17.6 [Labeo rohita]
MIIKTLVGTTLFKRQKGEKKEKGRRTYFVREEESSEREDTSDINTISSVSQVQPKVAPIMQKISVNGMEVDFEVHTGCGVTIISREQYSKLWKKTDMPEWRTCSVKLKTYTGEMEKMEVLGQATATVEIQNVRKEMTMVVVDGEGPNLLGRGPVATGDEPSSRWWKLSSRDWLRRKSLNQFAEWAAPIVPVKKPDGSGGQKFSKLDMSHAYQQIRLDESAKKYVTVNTQKGPCTYCRLTFGVASSHGMERNLQNTRHVAVYLDDILVTRANDEEHLRNLEDVLMTLKTSGLGLKMSKCEFLGEDTIFLGHLISSAGVQPVAEKWQEIQEAVRRWLLKNETMDKESLAVILSLDFFKFDVSKESAKQIIKEDLFGKLVEAGILYLQRAV